MIIFAEFLATQEWAIKELERLSPGRVAMMNGSHDSEQKAQAISFFEQEADVLVCTEAGAEGFNIQSKCHVVINLDMPWNPMRLEQRIGRIDRIGQTHRGLVVNIVVKPYFGGYDEYILGRSRTRAENIATDMRPVSDEYDDRYASGILGTPITLWDISTLLATAAGHIEIRTTEQIDTAIGRARSFAAKAQ